MYESDADAARSLSWPHGRFELQGLSAMLAPIEFHAPGMPAFSPMQIAPWADEPGSEALPGGLRRLRGDWPCVPFGRTDRPDGLPAGWSSEAPDDDFGHGFGAHHEWQWLAPPDALSLSLAIDYPSTSPVRRLVRTVTALADEAALQSTLEVEVRRPCTLPIALHPTIRLNGGRVHLQVPHAGRAHSYPMPAEPGISRLVPDQSFEHLHAAPLSDGSVVDLSRYPLPFDTEELLQLQSVTGPVTARFLDQGWALQLDWDRAALPDMMLWVSHRGRRYAPWNGRHWALGLEPVNGPFDLGRVARPPSHHPLASRTGVMLTPGTPWRLRSEFRALPLAAEPSR